MEHRASDIVVRSRGAFAGKCARLGLSCSSHPDSRRMPSQSAQSHQHRATTAGHSSLVGLLALVLVSLLAALTNADQESTMEQRLADALVAGDTQLAVAHAESLVAIDTNNDLTIEAVHDLLGNLYYQLDRPALARAQFQRSVEILASVDAPDSLWVLRLNNLAECSRAAGDLNAARKAFEDALNRQPNVQDPGCDEAVLLNNYAGLHRDLQNYDEAEPLLRKALAISIERECTNARTANANLNLAEILRMQLRFDEARPLYERALELSRLAYAADSPWIVFPLNQLAELHAESGNAQQAWSLRQEAEQVVRTLRPPRPVLLAQVLLDGAEDLLAAGNADAAAQKAQLARRLRQDVYGIEHPELALAIIVQIDAIATDAKGTLTEPQASELERAIGILAESGVAPMARVRGLDLAAAHEVSKENTAAAREHLERAIEIIERGRTTIGGSSTSRARLLAMFRRPYARLIDLHVSSGDIDAAFALVEQAKGRVLREHIALGLGNEAGGPSSDETATELESLRLRLAELTRRSVSLRWSILEGDPSTREQLAAVETSIDSLTASVHATMEARLRDQPAWMSILAQGSTGFDSDDANGLSAPLMNYFVGREHSYLFFKPSDEKNIQVFELVATETHASRLGISPGPFGLDDCTRALGDVGIDTGPRREGSNALTRDNARGLLAMWSEPSALRRRRDTQQREQRAQALFGILVPATIWNEISRVPAVIISPDASLHSLPFEALSLDDQGQMWINRGPAVHVIDSIASMRALQTRTPHRVGEHARILSVGNPTSGTGTKRSTMVFDTLGALPWSAAEVDSVRAIFAAEETTTLLGSDATEARVRAELSQASIVHFATHAVVRGNRNGLRAALALSPPANIVDARNDGALHLFELGELNLNCRLAVLSACDTQRGAVILGEGAQALGRGFLAAGAQRVVATRWAIDDRATTELVAGFLRNVPVGQPDDFEIARALQEAKRRVKATPGWEHPYYWAAFSISGAP